MSSQDKNLSEQIVNDISLNIIAKSIFKETSALGFSKSDYVKLINLILDNSLTDNSGETKKNLAKNHFPQKKLSMPLKSERLKIRNVNADEDRKLLEKWVSQENGRYFLLTRTFPRQYRIDELIENEEDLLGIVTTKDGEPIGVQGFLDWNKELGKAELRKMIGERGFRGKGLGKEAAKLWIQYGISTLGLKKIYLNTLETNVRNIRINRDLGFNVEGILRNECMIDGKLFDVLRMALIVD